MRMPNTQRPPYRSVQIPRNSRLIEPVRIGVAIRRPSWVSDSPRSSAMRMPMMEKMVHTAKHKVKASVERPSARYCCGLVGEIITAALSVCIYGPLFRASITISKAAFSVWGHWGYLQQGGLVVGADRDLLSGGRASIALVGYLALYLT